MTPDDIARIAERARDTHRRVLGLTPQPWHRITQEDRDAWLASTALIVTETRREAQLERLEIAREQQG